MAKVAERVNTDFKTFETVEETDFLKQDWQAELGKLDDAMTAGLDHSIRRQADMFPLLKASGLSETELAGKLDENKRRSKEFVAETEKAMAEEAPDFEALHKQELDFMKSLEAERLITGSGTLWNPTGGMAWTVWNGEAEEVPTVAFNLPAKRFDCRTRANGDGLFDADFSILRAGFQYVLNPPTMGHLHVYPRLWLNGFHALYSDDEWWNMEYASAKVNTWIQCFQVFPRHRQWRRRFTMRGDELHPAQLGSIVQNLGHDYRIPVAANIPVFINVGVKLRSFARAGGGHSMLDFRTGPRCVRIPFVQWVLHI